jgi:hypothetical protein
MLRCPRLSNDCKFQISVNSSDWGLLGAGAACVGALGALVLPVPLLLRWFEPLWLSWFGPCACGTDQGRERYAASGTMAVEVSVRYMSVGWACGRAARGG